MRTLGIVLAGGVGARLGAGVPKALATLAGEPLLARAIATIAPVCDDWVVAAPATLALPVPATHRVHDVLEGAGPLAGLVAALAARPCARAVVLGVDLPLVTSALLAAMGEHLGGSRALVPEPRGRMQPLAAWFAGSAHAPLAAALDAGERALVPAVSRLAPVRLDDAVLAGLPGGIEAFLNVNTPDDRAEAERRLARTGVA